MGFRDVMKMRLGVKAAYITFFLAVAGLFGFGRAYDLASRTSSL